MDDNSLPSRADLARHRSVEWIQWLGLGRIVTAAMATLLVCAGGYWLLRSPPPDVAMSLPVATSSPDGPQATLAPPSTLAPATSVPPAVVVHVTGAVRAPGVYDLPLGERVRDAIDAAGGPTKHADASRLNLAAPLLDGSRIQVPRQGEELEQPLSGAVPASVPQSSIPAGPVDVNRAAADELETLPGVGPATALAIISDRDENGPFVSVDDVDRVPGIGPSKLAALRDLIAV